MLWISCWFRINIVCWSAMRNVVVNHKQTNIHNIYYMLCMVNVFENKRSHRRERTRQHCRKRRRGCRRNFTKIVFKTSSCFSCGSLWRKRWRHRQILQRLSSQNQKPRPASSSSCPAEASPATILISCGKALILFFETAWTFSRTCWASGTCHHCRCQSGPR